MQLSRQRGPQDPVYGHAVQSAYNHLVLLCLRCGEPPPDSVPGMVRWAAERTLRDWPLALPTDLEAADGYLVDTVTRMPTQQCFEWAISAPDPAAEEFENQLLREALTTTRAAKEPQAYTAFRKLLITRPVLTGTELALLGADLYLALLHDTIKRSYEPAPASYLHDDQFAECERCHCLLVPVGLGTQRGWRCELDRCQRERHARIGRRLSPALAGGVYQLTRPLRMFITGPGLAETELETALVALNLKPEMWPNFDAYDLRITLPDQQVWAIDVKDRANPALLGRNAQPLRPDPPYDRALLVVPQYRFDEREAYQRIFNHHGPDEIIGRLELLSDSQLLRRVKTELRRIRHRSSEPAAPSQEGPSHA